MRSHSTPGPFLRPVRVTITIPYNAYQSLIERSNQQGRSLSNLAAYLLETSLQAFHPNENYQSRSEAMDGFQRRPSAAVPAATPAGIRAAAGTA